MDVAGRYDRGVPATTRLLRSKDPPAESSRGGRYRAAARARGLVAIACLVCLGGCSERAADRPDRVVVVYPAGPPDLRPHVANDEHTFSVLGNVYETLVELGTDLRLQPALAESWYTVDDHTWVFDIRPGVELHSGRMLTIDDVVESLERARSDPTSRRRAELLDVESINPLGEHRVAIRTRHPVAVLPNRLGSVRIGIEDPNVPWPVGTGPYRVEEWSAGGTTVLRAFEAYRTPVPVRELVFRVVPDEDERLRLLLDGEAHLTANISIDRLDALEDEGRVKVLRNRGLAVFFLAMDCARAESSRDGAGPNPFRDLRVRQAVAHGLDREKLVAEALGGGGEVIDQAVGPEVFGYHPGLTPWAYDPDKSRRLMSEAGFGAGFSVVLDYDRGGVSDSVITALSSDLRGIGIEIEPRAQDLQSLMARIEGRRTELYLLPWISTSGDFGLTAHYLFHSPVGSHGIDNGGGYSNPRVDELLAEASKLLEPKRRKVVLHAVAEIIHDDVPVVPLFPTVDNYVVAADLVFRPRLDRQVRGIRLSWATPRQ